MRGTKYIAGGAIAALATVGLAATATAESSAASDALDIPGAEVVSTSVVGTDESVWVSTQPWGPFPTEGSSYLVLSTGTEDFLSENGFDSGQRIGNEAGVTGNDMSQVAITMTPPTGATCVRFDFAFFTNEYPEFVGSPYNDIFTAELNQSEFSYDEETYVVGAPNNFAFDAEGNFVSINIVQGLVESETKMDGESPALAAITPVDITDAGTMELILSIQDLSDDFFNSAAIVDNVQYFYGGTCESAIIDPTDENGNGIPDVIEGGEGGLTTEPTEEPTTEPTEDPTVDETEEPTTEPTEEPTEDPTVDETEEPTTEPTEEATTAEPTTAAAEPTTSTAATTTAAATASASLPDTGTSPTGAIAVTTLLLGLGTAIMLLVWRRRSEA